MVIEHVKGLIANVKEIAQIPDVINHYFNRLSELKFHYFLLMCGGFGTLLVSQLFEYRLIVKSFRELKLKREVEKRESKKAEKAEKTKEIKTEETVTTDQLTTILTNQQELMTKIIDLQSEMQETINKDKKKKK